jgi:regulator of RNase E activity RraA
MSKYLIILLFLQAHLFATAQRIGASPEYIRALTIEWKGERLPDGRPWVPDNILQRLQKISIEEAWTVLRSKGYDNQYEGNWLIIHPDSVMTGRVVTAQYMPLRPDLQQHVKEQGKLENRSQVGATHAWPVDILTNGDVYVADAYGKVAGGPLIGDNMGNAISARSANGVIFYGSARDLQGLSTIKGFNGWLKAQDPSFIQDMMLTGINIPIRIGQVSVLPGDIVLANRYGTVFIPAAIAEELVVTAEISSLKDVFGHQRLKEKKYSAGAIDGTWTDAIKKDFFSWLDQYAEKPPLTKKQILDYLDKNY